MKHFASISELNQYLGYRKPKKEIIDVVRFNDYKSLRLSSPNISSDFLSISFKRNMTDLNWYGNTAFDTQSAFMYSINPKQVHSWEVKQQWSGYYIIISPILLKEHNIEFSFFNYEINEALFLTNEEQAHIEVLFEQVYTQNNKDDYVLDLLLAYCNLIFTYVEKCYKRQFETREPLYNKLIIKFKQLLEEYYLDKPTHIPTVNFFAEKLNVSTNYFGDLVKHQTGRSATELIQDKIIAESKNKLQSYEKNVSEIAHELGFEYPTYFTRLFKKHTGITPSQFRGKSMK